MPHLRALCLSLLLILAPVAAFGHAQLVAASPGEGSIVEAFPASVTLTFSEAVAPLVLRWIAPDGSAETVQADALDTILTLPAPRATAPGSYLLSWRVVSDDGHPVGGVLTLHLGAPSLQTGPAPATTGARLAAAARFGLTLAMLGAVGLALHAALIARAAPSAGRRRLGLVTALAGLALAVAFLWSHGLDLLALSPTEGLTAAPFRAALAAPLLRTVALSGLALLLAALALRQPHPARGLALLAWLCAGLSFAGSGHAVTAPPVALSTLAVAVHGVALVWWMGLLPPLLTDLRHPEAALRLRRFATPALGLVALLVLSGAWLTWVQSGGALAGLTDTGWGRLLLVKLALVAGLLVLAGLNRLRLTPGLARGRMAPLAASIRAEILLGLGVLLIAALFRLTPPPRAMIDTAPPILAHLHGDRVMADLRLSPGAAGPVVLELAFQTGDFAPLEPREVTLALAPADGRLEPLRLRARAGADGIWRTDPVVLPFGGDWAVSLRVLVSDFDSVTLRETLTLRE